MSAYEKYRNELPDEICRACSDIDELEDEIVQLRAAIAEYLSVESGTHAARHALAKLLDPTKRQAE